jgi:hypothetical protein
MRFLRIVVPIVLVGMAAWAVEGCSDKGTEPPQEELSVSATTFSIVPGTVRSLFVSGGRPPYHVVEYPIPQVANVYWENDDSTGDPSVLKIEVISSATIGDDAVLSVDDSDPTNGNPLMVTIDVVAVGDVSYSDDIQPIWDSNCQNRGCHPGGGAPFSLNRFVSYNNLYFFPVSNTTCGVPFRLVPGSPDSSQVYLMVSGRTTCSRMPFSPLPGDTLSLSDQYKIRDWIEQGAANN